MSDGAAEIALHRLADRFLHRSLVVAHEGVKHQRGLSVARVAGLLPCLAVDREFLGKLLDALAEQVRQKVVAAFARHAKRLGVSGSSDPDREIFLHRARERLHLHGIARRAFVGPGLAAPERTHVLDLLEHERLTVGEVLRLNHEVVRLPACGEGDADAAVRQVVDHRPVLGDTHRVMQRRHAASRADLNVLGARRNRCADHRRVRVQSAEVVEVTLGRPHGFKTIAIGKFGAVQQHLVLLPWPARRARRAFRRWRNRTG